MAAHELIRLNEIDDNDEESGKSNETNGSGDESPNSVEEEPPSKDELIAVIDRLKNVTLNFVICFELLNSPLLVIEANNKRITFPVYDTSHSIEMKADDFKITNPCWIEYLDNYVVPQIKLKMVLDFDVFISLKKFSLIQSESIETSLCDVDEDENTFATFVIQLPCKYEGGRHDIKRNDCISHRFDISVTSNKRYEFSSFGIVYHRNYKHQLLPITKGVGAYLVYSLKVKSTATNSIPKELTHEDKGNQMELMELLRRWAYDWDGNPGKLVIGLSNKYTKQNLSFENLKSTDLAIATLLKRYSSYSSLLLFTGFLKRTHHGEVPDKDTKFDTKDASNILQTDYDIECLKCIDGNEFVQFLHMNVNFNEEVWPDNCFDDVPFHRCQRDRFYNLKGPSLMMQFYGKDNFGFHIAKYYRVPVLVIFKRNSFIDELKKCHTQVADIYKIFSVLYHQFYDTKPIENFEYNPIKGFDQFDANFRHWALTVSVMILRKANTMQSKAIIIGLLNVFICLGDLSPIKYYFENNPNLNDDIIPLLISQCSKFGWLPFSDILCNMFKEVKRFSTAQKYFQQFIETGPTDPNKQIVLQSVFNAILDNESERHHYEMQSFFDAAWSFAAESGMDIREFSKSQSILDMVPFLINQAEHDPEIMSDQIWFEIVDHFLMKMKGFVAKKPTTNWRQRNVKITGNCNCLQNLKHFLNDNVESITFNLYKNHRNHIRKALNHVLHVVCSTRDEPGKADIVVRKIRHTDQNNVNNYERILHLYNQVRSMCESKS